jgi:hypothetical protein
MGLAVATGKVRLSDVRRGLGLAGTFSKPETFLEAHRGLPPVSAVPAARSEGVAA